MMCSPQNGKQDMNYIGKEVLFLFPQEKKCIQSEFIKINLNKKDLLIRREDSVTNNMTIQSNLTYKTSKSFPFDQNKINLPQIRDRVGLCLFKVMKKSS